MKGEFAVLFIFVILGLSLTLAGSCDNSQSIMRLYASTNSHVSAWDQGAETYSDKVCYNDIF